MWRVGKGGGVKGNAGATAVGSVRCDSSERQWTGDKVWRLASEGQ